MEEHREIIEDYQSKFYHFLYTLVNSMGEDLYPDIAFPDIIYHPTENISINIVGREH